MTAVSIADILLDVVIAVGFLTISFVLVHIMLAGERRSKRRDELLEKELLGSIQEARNRLKQIGPRKQPWEEGFEE